MEVFVNQGSIQDSEADTIIVNLFEAVTDPAGATAAIDTALDGAVKELILDEEFKGSLGQVAVLHPRDKLKAKRVIIVGLGKKDNFDLEAARKASAAAIKNARTLRAKDVATIVHGGGSGFDLEEAAQATVEGSLLASYRFDADKRKDNNQHNISTLTITEFDGTKIAEIEKGVATGSATFLGASLARDLVNMPPNVATPTRMAEAAAVVAHHYGQKLIVGGRKWARKREMGAFLSVAKGAGEPPKFIVLEHNHERDDLETFVLVGKGITFDTGGISLKPVLGMGLMKSDMGGAAAVIGTMRAIGELDLPYRVIGIAPCTENMPDANAYRPADVIKASNGKTIEIISTDAEGRMVLADALVYASNYDPVAVIDLATLTGACVTALGEGVAAGIFSTDDWLQDQLVAAGQKTHERLWPLPLWDDYKKKIKSKVADVQNSGGRFSGVGSSAIFLKEFTQYPWAHLDIAGMAFTKKSDSYIPAGGTGFGVRLLVEFFRRWQSP